MTVATVVESMKGLNSSQHLSLGEIAKVTGVSRTSVSRWAKNLNVSNLLGTNKILATELINYLIGKGQIERAERVYRFVTNIEST